MAAGANALGVFNYGPCTATYAPPTGAAGYGSGALALGMCEGFKVFSRTLLAEAVRSDDFGDTIIDHIMRGGDGFFRMTFKEWKAGNKAVIWPFNSDLGILPQPGIVLSDYAGSLVLTPIAGTTAAVNGFATRTFGKCILSPGHNVEEMIGATQKNLPVVFQLYPYLDSGSYRLFKDT